MRLALLPLLFLAACAAPPAAAPGPPVVLTTDFGLRDDAVGLMRGVILSIAPRATLADLCHEVTPFDLHAGARILGEAPGLYPPGSVFCVVVDPGVGTARRAIVARLPEGTLLVAPDNGVLTEALARHGPAEVRQVTNTALMRAEMSSTFHGRDLFAPVAGHLAAGVPFAEVGPLVEDWIRLDELPASKSPTTLTGTITSLDLPFGNVWTNLPAEWAGELGLEWGVEAFVVVGEGLNAKPFTLPWCETFGEVELGEPLLYPNSRGKLALALNQGNFAETHGLRPGAKVVITKKR